MTDDIDHLADARRKAWATRRLKYGPSGCENRRAPYTISSALEPRRAYLVPLPDSVASELQTFFYVNAEHFAKSR